VATVVARKRAWLVLTGQPCVAPNQAEWPTFLPSGMVAERSSPSRVRSRRTERALNRSGPL